MQLSEAAVLLNAHTVGEDVVFLGCSTDSRTIARGAMFVALRGPHFDGHDFLGHAHQRGAAAALVEDTRERRLPSIRVNDTQRGLGALATAWRSRFAVPLMAVTGSNGKTTVKEMLASIFALRGPVYATRGNLNNEIGLPLTLLSLDAAYRAVIVELGANHPGEIARLAVLAKPTIGVITQCAPAHLEGFGDLAGVARAKGELFENLPADGTAVLNADDPFASLWRDLAGARRCLSFGSTAPADVHGTWRREAAGSVLALETPIGSLSMRIPLPGAHNVANAMAATAAAIAADASADEIVAGLEAVRPVAGRLQSRHGPRRVCVLDDTYNANPASLAAGLAVLESCAGRRWLVLGDMAELGPGAASFHADAGRLARSHGVERLYATGALSCAAVHAFGAGAQHYDDQAELIAALHAELPDAVTVLVKGSRCMHMECVVAALTDEADGSDKAGGA